MGKFRPAGWENPSKVIICGELTEEEKNYDPEVVKYFSYEAGADAMLDALREVNRMKRSDLVEITMDIHNYVAPEFFGDRIRKFTLRGVQGTLVFIPDDTDNKEVM